LTAVNALAVVVVTHNSAADLPGLLDDLREQLDDGDEVVVVDNQSGDGTPDVARRHPAQPTVLETGTNLGFGGGCHAGARTTTAPLLLYINPDSRLEPGCLTHLRATGDRFPEWDAWQAAVLLPADLINTDGGVVHFLGMGWAGDCGRPVSELPAAPQEVTFPSGAAMVVRRSRWDALGGFESSYFMYCEDLDLGLRIWLSGGAVGMVPQARVVHSYDFEKGSQKWFWLERNRLRTVLAVYPTALLLLLAPALIGAELALVVMAGRGGWLTAKLRAQLAVLAGLPEIARRRRRVQGTRAISAAVFAGHLTASLESDFLPNIGVGAARHAQAGYWRAITRTLHVFSR
jgi:N-acetylglucosaminyl-diphospho-decaprenol L-rhamnosyltransferase